MYHAVWKLTALAVVLAIGVAVVIHAQRGMNGTDPEAGKEVAGSGEQDGAGEGTNDVFDDSDLPAQGEPDMSADRVGSLLRGPKPQQSRLDYPTDR
jgi:hypothetical protein